MKFCKKCGTLYGNSLGVCPRCNVTEAEQAATDSGIAPTPATKEQVKRHWLAICLGIPGLILFLYLVIWGVNALGNP